MDPNLTDPTQSASKTLAQLRDERMAIVGRMRSHDAQGPADRASCLDDLPALQALAADPSAATRADWSAALLSAVSLERVEAARVCAPFADCDTVDTQGYSPLMIASKHEGDAIFDLLLSRSDVNKARADGVTALGLAAGKGNLSHVQKLIAAGAKIGAQKGPAAPLESALRGMQWRCFDALLDAASLTDIEEALFSAQKLAEIFNKRAILPTPVQEWATAHAKAQAQMEARLIAAAAGATAGQNAEQNDDAETGAGGSTARKTRSL